MNAPKFDVINADVSGLTLIEASAGTGKTYTLALLYVRLLLERNLSVRQILVVTFTKAATAELRTRILKFLQDLLDLYENKPSLEVDSNLQQLQTKFNKDTAKNKLILAIHGFDEASIYTIHGFCQRALSESAFEAANDFSNELIHDDSKFINQVVLDLWRSESANFDALWSDFLIEQNLTPQKIQQEIKPYLGKDYLKVNPSPAIGALKLDHNQVTKLRETWRTSKKLWALRKDIWQEILVTSLKDKKINGAKIRADYLHSWFTETELFFKADSPSLDKKILEKISRIAANYVREATKNPHSPVQDELSFKLQELVDELTNLHKFFNDNLAKFKAKFLAQTNQNLPNLKAQQRVLAFDDLINFLAKALGGKGGLQLATSLRERFPLALIDEFQDTDPAQYQIFSTIYPPQKNANLCLVGDPKQAIYAFRSADFATYIRASKQVQNKYSLAINYRTSSTLISALNYLFSGKNPFADNNLSYPYANSHEGLRRKLVLPTEFGEQSCTLVRLSLYYLKSANARELAALDVAITIAKLLNAGAKGCAYFVAEDGTHKNITNNDIAILVANHNEAKLIGKHLTSQGIDWVRQTKDSVFASVEAKELDHVLSAYLDPQNEGLLRYALTSCFLGKNADEIHQLGNDVLAFEEQLKVAINYAKLWNESGFFVMFRAWLQEQQVAVRLLKLADGERRLTNLLHLGQLLQQEAISRKNPQSLLLWLKGQLVDPELNENTELRLESDANRVTISTIHAAKGLEYNLVFCPFLWNAGGRKKSNSEVVRVHTQTGESIVDFGGENYKDHLITSKTKDFAEKMRVLYVALTRAKERLWLYWGAVECGLNSRNQLSANGLHTSSLGWLLHGRDGNDDPLTSLHTHFKNNDALSLNLELENLIAKSNNTIKLQDIQDTELKIESTPSDPQTLQVASFERTLRSSWQVTSFSHLVQHVPHSLPPGDGDGIFAFPKGANAGNCLHNLLEEWANGRIIDVAYVQQVLQRYNFDANLWGEMVFQHLQEVLEAKLAGDLSLNSIDCAQRFAELNFTFSLGNLRADKLAKVLAHSKFRLNPSFSLAAQSLDFAQIKGFMNGFIDLTFCYQDVWYLADYKSNWLGPNIDFYQESHVIESMAREHYYLQALIYSVALRRFLKLRMLDTKFGGVFYLFIRGLPKAGIYFDCFNEDLLDELDNLFA